MPSQSLVNLPFQNFLSGLQEFYYSPWTNWENLFRGWFSFSPTFNFGRNVEDAPVERHVLNEVGSYGKQLNRVIDVLSVLVGELKQRETLTPQEQRYVYAFEDLARAADAAATEAQRSSTRREVTRSDINQTIDQILDLKDISPARFQDICADIQRRLAL